MLARRCKPHRRLHLGTAALNVAEQHGNPGQAVVRKPGVHLFPKPERRVRRPRDRDACLVHLGRIAVLALPVHALGLGVVPLAEVLRQGDQGISRLVRPDVVFEVVEHHAHEKHAGRIALFPEPFERDALVEIRQGFIEAFGVAEIAGDVEQPPCATRALGCFLDLLLEEAEVPALGRLTVLLLVAVPDDAKRRHGRAASKPIDVDVLMHPIDEVAELSRHDLLTNVPKVCVRDRNGVDVVLFLLDEPAQVPGAYEPLAGVHPDDVLAMGLRDREVPHFAERLDRFPDVVVEDLDARLFRKPLPCAVGRTGVDDDDLVDQRPGRLYRLREHDHLVLDHHAERDRDLLPDVRREDLQLIGDGLDHLHRRDCVHARWLVLTGHVELALGVAFHASAVVANDWNDRRLRDVLELAGAERRDRRDAQAAGDMEQTRIGTDDQASAGHDRRDVADATLAEKVRALLERVALDRRRLTVEAEEDSRDAVHVEPLGNTHRPIGGPVACPPTRLRNDDDVGAPRVGHVLAGEGLVHWQNRERGRKVWCTQPLRQPAHALRDHELVLVEVRRPAHLGTDLAPKWRDRKNTVPGDLVGLFLGHALGLGPDAADVVLEEYLDVVVLFFQGGEQIEHRVRVANLPDAGYEKPIRLVL